MDRGTIESGHFAIWRNPILKRNWNCALEPSRYFSIYVCSLASSHDAWRVAVQTKSIWIHCFVQTDDRNFHCWDHRRAVCELAGVTSDAEWQYTTEKINENFSNYSTYHYRSKLMTKVSVIVPCETLLICYCTKTIHFCFQLYPSSPNGLVVPEAILRAEFKTALTAIYTDPDDSTAFFYLQWLLCPVPSEAVRLVSFCLENGCFAAVFNKPLVPSDFHVWFISFGHTLTQVIGGGGGVDPSSN